MGNLRLKDSDGKKFYANLPGQWYALMLLGSADGQAITGTVAIR